MEIQRLHRHFCQSVALLFALLSCLLVMAACGNDDEPATSASTEPSDASEPSDVTEPSGSTNELADGSGCTPSSETDLPDGRWYGSIAEAGDSELVFDLACFFTGDPAVAAAAEDGEESPPPNGYHVRNANALLRTLDVQTEAPVSWYPDGGDPANVVTVAYSQWRTDKAARGYDLGVWITTSGGVIVAIEEQWVP